uniref:DNA-directed RNA polymerase n=1 Tax=Marophrys sp. SRT127 TaxID=2488311 RepID=A0A455REQ0_9EUKA|nr:RNA polymerase [Marophrys sp. SRT127]
MPVKNGSKMPPLIADYFATVLRVLGECPADLTQYFKIEIVASAIVVEFFKVFIQVDGVEEVEVRRRIIKRVTRFGGFINLDSGREGVMQKEKVVSLLMSLVVGCGRWCCYRNGVGHNRNVSYLVPFPAVYAELAADVQFAGVDLPRLIKPVVNPENLVRNSYKNKGVSKVSNDVVQVAQKLGETELCVNCEVLDWFIDNKKLWVPELPGFEDLKGLSNGYCYKTLHSVATEIRTCNNILAVAALYRKVPKFYFPQFLDWRGRFYAIGEYIGYQSHKVGLSLLRFAKPKPLGVTGLTYLKLYGARLYGIGVSNEQRLEWVDKHHSLIMQMDTAFLKRAKEFPLFIGFCLEYRACMRCEEPTLFESTLPILMDCTCNGLQHLSCFILDSKLSTLVNLHKSQHIEDLYQHVANALNKKLKLEWKIKREMVKLIVMTVPYNASEYTASEYFIQKFVYNPQENMYSPPDNLDVKLDYKTLYHLGKKVYRCFYKDNPKLAGVVSYFKDMSNLMSSFNCGVEWITPSGLTVQQEYVSFDVVKTKGLWKTRDMSISVPSDKINKRKQRDGLMPNVVHSFDAANIVATAKVLHKKNIEFFTIHDCFAAHASEAEFLKTAV